MRNTLESELPLLSLIHEPEHLITYSKENSGYFADIASPVEPNELQGNEIFMASTIRLLLDRQDVVRALDIGGMLGASFVRIASQFPEEIAQGRLQIIVTNLEPDFTIICGIAEAKRRLFIHTNWDAIVDLWQKDKIQRVSLQDWGKKLILASMEEITFLENNHHLVTYRSGVDTLQLPETLTHKGDIIHERLGGFHHHKNKERVLPALQKVLRPESGIIMTTTEIDSYLFVRDDHQQFERMRLRYLGQLPGEYWLYGRPEAIDIKNLTTLVQME